MGTYSSATRADSEVVGLTASQFEPWPALSAEFLDMANWIDEILYDLMTMRKTDRTNGSL